jgi:clan AA aspartic protease (TIGR02281 family)
MLRPLLFAAIVAVSAASLPAPAQDAKCKLQKVVEWPVRMIRGHFVVDGAINGQKAGIMIDTGATHSMMLRSSATKLGLETKEARGFRMFGIGGETKVETTVVDELRLGEVPVRTMQLLVAGERDLGAGIDVMLGEEFFRNFDVEFDLQQRAVRLWTARGCEGVSLAYWTKDPVAEVAIDAVTDMRRQIVLTVRFNDKPVEAILDSGASSSLLTKQDAEALGQKQPEEPSNQKFSGIGAKSAEMWVASFATFAIGNESIDGVEIRVADFYKASTFTTTGSLIAKNLHSKQPMLLGADFLRSHRVLVSHSQSKMYFTYTGGPVFLTGRAKPPAPSAPPATPDTPKRD